MAYPGRRFGAEAPRCTCRSERVPRGRHGPRLPEARMDTSNLYLLNAPANIFNIEKKNINFEPLRDILSGLIKALFYLIMYSKSSFLSAHP